MSKDKRTFKFGTRKVSIFSKQDLIVERLIDRDIIKSYIIKTKEGGDKRAFVQCTNKYFIVLYLGQECGYVENKKDKCIELFEFSCPYNDFEFFDLKKYKTSNHEYNYTEDDKDLTKILSFKEGVFYINSKGYTHNEKERIGESDRAI